MQLRTWIISLIILNMGSVAAAVPKKSIHLYHRRVEHTHAYDKRTDLGQHSTIKVTPPEARGKKGVVLVEVYNYTQVYFSVMDFYIMLHAQDGAEIEMHIKVDDLRPNWGDIAEVKIPGQGNLQKIKSLTVKKMQIFDERGKRVAVPILTDLITN